jgi:ribosomal-protein-alanine N-acetyltransferase
LQSELITNRLSLRNITLDDYKDLFEIRFHPEVIKHIQRKKVEDEFELKNFISDKIQDIKNGDLCFWALSFLDCPKLIGTICLWNFNDTKTVAEIGYELYPDYHGKGLMSEALEVVLNFGFKNLKLTTIEAFTSQHNESSKALLKKFDFNIEASRKDEGFSNNIIYTKHNA